MKKRLMFYWFAFVLACAALAPALTGAPAHAAGQSQAAAMTAPDSAEATCLVPFATVASANRLGYNQIAALSAAAPNDLWAIGNYFNPTLGLQTAMTLHGNGSTWTLVPQAVTTTTVQLHGVAAVAPSDVWAVGSRGSTYAAALTEHWNGQSWQVVPSPNPGGPLGSSTLNAVVAIASDDVWAVGNFNNPSGPTSGALLMHWDGTQWSLEAGAANASYTNLVAIAAVATNDIWAAGTGAGQPVLWHWDGTQWTNVPVSYSPPIGTLTAIAARASNDVWAVGGDSGSPVQTLTLHWDGSQWSKIASPNPAGMSSTLNSVTIVAANDVWAVGTGISAVPTPTPVSTPVVEHWNGTAWSLVAGPVVTNGDLNAVLYPGSGGVWIGGGQDSPATLLARRNGSAWQIAATPNPGRAGNYLNAVGASGPDDIWAVGTNEVYQANSPYARSTAAQHWDGHQWTIMRPVNPEGGLTDNALTSVADVSSANVWAVGYVGDGIGGYGVLIEHWNGGAWSVVQQGNAEATPEQLFGVAAVSASNIWAVGSINAVGQMPGQTLIEHWNGSTWSTVPSPNVGSGTNALTSIAAISANDIWAAGYTRSTAAKATSIVSNQPLLLHWNGTQWLVVAAPAGLNGIIQSIAAHTAQDVWAVGANYADTTHATTLALHWDGSAWHTVSSPNPGSAINALTAIVAPAANDVWAAGFTRHGSFSQSLLLHWNGSAWTHVSSANPGQIDNYVAGLVHPAAADLWGVGFQSNGAPAQTLVLHAGAFSDVFPGDYYYTPMNYLLAHGAIGGYADCTFKPGLPATRAQLAKMIVITNGWALVSPSQPHFSDVPRTDPFYTYVETAYAHQIVSGYADGKFHPNDPVTRGQAAKMVVLARGWAMQNPATGHFSDVPHGSAFYTAVETAYAHGILSGYGDGTFRPAATITRGQATKIVYLAVH